MVIVLVEGAGNAPAPAMPVPFSRQVQPAYICLPSVKFTISDLRFTMALVSADESDA
jgi:hypothetical protein